MAGVVRHAPRTVPGPDGIPYTLWQACEASAATTLMPVLHALVAGALPPQDFSNAWLAMLPKHEAHRITACAEWRRQRRAPCAGRWRQSRTTHSEIARRDLAANIMDMDAYSRIFVAAAEAGISPTWLLLDLEAASPMVSRDAEPQLRRLCTLMGHGTEMLRPLQHILDAWNTRAPRVPIVFARQRALVPPAAARPVA